MAWPQEGDNETGGTTRKNILLLLLTIANEMLSLLCCWLFVHGAAACLFACGWLFWAVGLREALIESALRLWTFVATCYHRQFQTGAGHSCSCY